MAVETLLLTGLMSWIVLIVLLIIVFVASSIRKAIGVLMVPVCIMVGLYYLTNALGWHGLIMFFGGIFLTIMIATKKGT